MTGYGIRRCACATTLCWWLISSTTKSRCDSVFTARVGSYHWDCNLCPLFALFLTLMKSPMFRLSGNTLVYALCICCARVRSCSFRIATPLWTVCSNSCSSPTSTILSTFSWFSAWNVQYVFSGIGHNNNGEGVNPVNTSIGHVMCPALILPSLWNGEWLMIFWTATTIEWQCIASSFYSYNKAWIISNTSLHRRSIVPFAQGRYTVIKWWRIFISLVRLVINDAVKCGTWSVTGHRILPKHEIHLSIALVVGSQSALPYGCNHVYVFKSSLMRRT